MSEQLELRWELKKRDDGGALNVSYTLHNRGAAPVLVMDQMLVFGATEGYARDEGAIIARADPADSGLLHLSRARVPPYGRAMIELYPGVRPLAAGASISGTATVPLPLRAWHPNDRYRDLGAKPTRAVLEIGVLPGDSETEEWPTATGPQLMPSPPLALTAQRLVVGEIQPIP